MVALNQSSTINRAFQTAFLLYLAVIPISQALTSIANALVFLGFIAFVIVPFFKNEPHPVKNDQFLKNPLTWGIFMWLLAVAISLFGSDIPGSFISDFKKNRHLLFFFLFILGFRKIENLNLIFKVIWISCGLVAVYCTIQLMGYDFIHYVKDGTASYGFQDMYHGARASGFSGQPLTLAHQMQIPFLISLGLILSRLFYKKMPTSLEIFGFISTGFIVYSTKSMGVFLGIGSCFLVIVPSYFIHKNKPIVAIIAFVLQIILASLFLSQALKLPAIEAKFQGETWSQRVEIFSGSLHAFKEKPIFGVGYNRFSKISERAIVDSGVANPQFFNTHSHNNYLEILATTGVFGLFSYLFMWALIFFWLLRKLIKKQDFSQTEFGLLIGCLMAAISFNVAGLSQWSFGDSEIKHILMFLWALSYILTTSKKKLHSDPYLKP